MFALLPYMILAVIAGSCLPTQAGINSQLNLWTRSPVLTASISFTVGTMTLVTYVLFLRIPLPEIAALRLFPWWMWTGGCLGAYFVAVVVILAPKLGATSMMVLIIAGQMLASLLLDHFGLIGYPVHPLNVWRVIGVALVVGGVFLIRWF